MTDRDDTTRYLCAAAHLDGGFADGVIREFLTERTRAVPPTAGVRAGAVLAEAIAARARRKVRDSLVVLLFGGILLTLSFSLVISWLIIAMTVTVSVAFATGDNVDRAATARRVLLALGGGLVASLVLTYLFRSYQEASATSYSYEDPDMPAAVLAIMLLVTLLTVLLVDEFVVWRHIEDRFRRGYALPDPEPSELTPDVRPVFRFGSGSFLTQLRRHLHERRRMFAPGPDDTTSGNGASPVPAPVIVARGYRMFVGAGEPYGPWSLAVPLRPRKDAERVVALTAEGLYERVDRAMDSLRDAAHLSPGGRFAELRVNEQIVVEAEELIDNLEKDGNLAGDFLEDPTVSPYPLLRGQRVRELRDNPLEWARYYLRFQVETWDRDFVVSAFLHMAVSDTTLYVEWTPSVLLPIKKQYRAIDHMSDSPLMPLLKAVTRFLALPMTVLGRLATACSVIRPKRRPRDTLTPEMYGVAHSLREFAADTKVQNYFQLVDRSRYLKVLESRFTLALMDALDEAGYEVAAFEQQVATVANNNVFISGGSFTGNMVAGKGNAAGPVTAGAPVGAKS